MFQNTAGENMYPVRQTLMMAMGVKKIAIQQLNDAMFAIRKRYFRRAEDEWSEKQLEMNNKAEFLTDFYAEKFYHMPGHKLVGDTLDWHYKPYHEVFEDDDEDANIQDNRVNAQTSLCKDEVSIKGLLY